MSNEANIIDENYDLSLTEWEKDTIEKALRGCNYPGTHVDLVYKLLKKISSLTDDEEEYETENSVDKKWEQ